MVDDDESGGYNGDRDRGCGDGDYDSDVKMRVVVLAMVVSVMMLVLMLTAATRTAMMLTTPTIGARARGKVLLRPLTTDPGVLLSLRSTGRAWSTRPWPHVWVHTKVNQQSTVPWLMAKLRKLRLVANAASQPEALADALLNHPGWGGAVCLALRGEMSATHAMP